MDALSAFSIASNPIPMNAQLAIIPADVSHRDTIRNLYQLYKYDTSVFNGERVDASGLFSVTRYLDAYRREAERHPFVCRINNNLCGFALVRMLEPGLFSMAEFFVMRGYRRQGTGRRFASELFDRFPARWSVAQEEANIPARLFWEQVIQAYTAGAFHPGRSEKQPKGPKLEFTSSGE